jgi:hypothetical protein
VAHQRRIESTANERVGPELARYSEVVVRELDRPRLGRFGRIDRRGESYEKIEVVWCFQSRPLRQPTLSL